MHTLNSIGEYSTPTSAKCTHPATRRSELGVEGPGVELWVVKRGPLYGNPLNLPCKTQLPRLQNPFEGGQGLDSGPMKLALGFRAVGVRVGWSRLGLRGSFGYV